MKSFDCLKCRFLNILDNGEDECRKNVCGYVEGIVGKIMRLHKKTYIDITNEVKNENIDKE